MSAERALLAALAERPADELTWLAYADWLEEQGGERHLFVRLLLDLTRGAEDEARQADVRRRLKRLRCVDPKWREHVVQLRADLPLRFRVVKCDLHRGSSEMFDHPMTRLYGFVEQGTVRLRQPVVVHRRGRPAVRLDQPYYGPYVDLLGREVDAHSAGQWPFSMGLAWLGARDELCDHPFLVTDC